MTGFQPHLEEKAVSDILNRLIDLLDRQPMSERSRPPGFRVNDQELTSFFNLTDAQDRQLIWRFIEQLADADWIKISRGRKSVEREPWTGDPRISLVPKAEAAIRATLGRGEIETNYLTLWREAIYAAKEYFCGDIEPLSRSPLRVNGKSAQQVVDRLTSLKNNRQAKYAREISARIFWGLSKALDGRVDSINIAFGRQLLLEKPLLVNAHIPAASIDDLVFIENEVSYLAAMEDCPSNTGLIWTSGFMLSAKRLLEPNGIALHVSKGSIEGAGNLALELLRGAIPVRLFFFGDLDYSGMQILKQLRQVFPSIVCWDQGYQFLVDQLLSGNAHAPNDADKSGQVDPITTGCQFADTNLLPQIRDGIDSGHGFVDQEVYDWKKQKSLSD
ncbi:MAG TPA: Wadjet anti-phage system protein JetD domain-containing protein [Gammaproteobacteria bacterium]|nr:Wadjet anti-phage system protein JetD domain-containing protein [Gammaproteobacteria bacterium]